MPVYIGLLRGVNVGNNILKMDRLRHLCAKLGLKNVCTYLQSGNVVFQAAGSTSQWAKALESKLTGESRLPVTVLVRTAAEWAGVIKANPFLEEKSIDRTGLHVTFLAARPAPAVIERLRAIEAGPDRFHPAAEEIYLHCPNGYGRSKLSNTVIERVLAVRATTRNWNTILKLGELSAR